MQSTDGGQSWTVLNYPFRREHAPIAAVAISPTYAEDGIVLISVKGRGLFQYHREQQTFTPMGSNLLEHHHVLNAIVYSPTYALDHTIYGASDEAFLRSTDGGTSWQLIETPAYPRTASNQAASAVKQP